MIKSWINRIFAKAKHYLFKPEKLQFVAIEGFLLLTVILTGFLMVVGPLRRVTRSRFLNLCMLGAYTTAPYLISNVLGRMTHVRRYYNDDDTYLIIWGSLILIVYASADNINALNVRDNEEHKRYMIQFIVFASLFGLLLVQTGAIFSVSNLWLFSLLWLFIYLKVEERQYAFVCASKTGITKISRIFSDFMMYEHTMSRESEANPTTLQGYKYLVEARNIAYDIDPPSYQMEIDLEKAMTIEKIWNCEGGILNSSKNGHLKDLCLSFSLFWLLLRRYAGFPLHEITHAQDKCLKFVWQGLLADHDVTRVFKVIEMELKFMYGYFYTKYYASYVGDKQFLKRLFLLALLGSSSFFYIFYSFGSLSLFNEPMESLCTVIVVIVIFIVECVQLGILFTSEWTKVKLICFYVRNQHWKTKRGRFLGTIIQFICRFPNYKPWGRKLGQYSLLHSYGYNPYMYRLARHFIGNLVEIPRPGQELRADVEVAVDLKEALISTLQRNHPSLHNGITSLQSTNKQAYDLLAWAWKLETYTHVILVWHIGTSLCEMDYDHKNKPRPDHLTDFKVAKQLSMYCAYLVVFAPNLLPDPEQLSSSVFEHVITEVTNFFGKTSGGNHNHRRRMDKYEKMMNVKVDTEQPHKRSNIERGAVLGQRLLSIDDEETRWKVLAKFWAELLLFLAPSNNHVAHVEYLAKGGELITHLWVLLTHAGIVDPSKPSSATNSTSEGP